MASRSPPSRRGLATAECEAAPQRRPSSPPSAAALDLTATHWFAAVVVIGSNACERCGLLTGDPADLGHAHQDGDGGGQTDAIDTFDQIEPLGEITMLADRRHQSFELDFLALFEPSNILLPGLPEPWVAAGLHAILSPPHIPSPLIH